VEDHEQDHSARELSVVRAGHGLSNPMSWASKKLGDAFGQAGELDWWGLTTPWARCLSWTVGLRDALASWRAGLISPHEDPGRAGELGLVAFDGRLGPGCRAGAL